ncbi:hypothetical protein ACLQ28_21140 [Micromonospora sp. DT201]|uniref:hypothetical protein n=1 Tax=Micromonospora sp. DT201 TaxID=3393442 RepID=UPI003CEA64A8
MTPTPPRQVPEDDAHPAGPAMYALTGWPVLAVQLPRFVGNGEDIADVSAPR